jgi:hypothetical protein
LISFNPKPEATAGREMDHTDLAPAIASGFGLNMGVMSSAILIIGNDLLAGNVPSRFAESCCCPTEPMANAIDSCYNLKREKLTADG